MRQASVESPVAILYMVILIFLVAGCFLENFGMVMMLVPLFYPVVIRGVTGIMGPHVETAADAKALVDACRYVPDGQRSWGGGRGTYYNSTALLDALGGECTEFMRQTTPACS